MTHTLSCLVALACWQFLDQLVTTFLEPVQVKERTWANREGAGSLPEPEPWPGCDVVRRPCTQLGKPCRPRQTGWGTRCTVPTTHRRLEELPGPLWGGAGGLSAPSAPGVLRELAAARSGKEQHVLARVPTLTSRVSFLWQGRPRRRLCLCRDPLVIPNYRS